MKQSSSKNKSREASASLHEVLHDATGQFSVIDILSAINDLLKKQSWSESLKEIIQEAETIEPVHIDLALRALIDKPDHELAEKLNGLTGYLRSRISNPTRCAIITTIAHYPPIFSAQELLRIASDQNDDREVRLTALRALANSIADSTVFISLHNLIDPELFRTKNFSEQDVIWAIAVLNVLEAHPAQISGKALTIVESLVYAQDLRLCRRALEVAGTLGEIDAIERLCIAVLRRPELQKSLTTAIQRISNKPISLRHLRWENFEELMRQMLRGMGHFAVEVTQASYDNGVDVISKRSDGDGEEAVVVVQCKLRYQGNISREDVEHLRDAMQQHKAKEGILITTGGFSRDAKEYQEQNKFIRLFDKKELLQRLDKVFGEGRYKI